MFLHTYEMETVHYLWQHILYKPHLWNPGSLHIHTSASVHILVTFYFFSNHQATLTDFSNSYLPRNIVCTLYHRLTHPSVIHLQYSIFKLAKIHMPPHLISQHLVPIYVLCYPVQCVGKCQEWHRKEVWQCAMYSEWVTKILYASEIMKRKIGADWNGAEG